MIGPAHTGIHLLRKFPFLGPRGAPVLTLLTRSSLGDPPPDTLAAQRTEAWSEATTETAQSLIGINQPALCPC
jgi:hypothetical protein